MSKNKHIAGVDLPFSSRTTEIDSRDPAGSSRTLAAIEAGPTDLPFNATTTSPLFIPARSAVRPAIG
jgi:hypothetical protein